MDKKLQQIKENKMIKEQIKEALLEKGNFNNKLTDYGLNIWRDLIYGDYSEKDYLNALEMQKETNKKKLRTYVEYNYCSLISREFNCSYSYAQKCLVNLFGLQSLESINEQLINEIKELDK